MVFLDRKQLKQLRKMKEWGKKEKAREENREIYL